MDVVDELEGEDEDDDFEVDDEESEIAEVDGGQLFDWDTGDLAVDPDEEDEEDEEAEEEGEPAVEDDGDGKAVR